MSQSQLPSDLMEALMRDPTKRALILQLLTQERGNIEKYKREQLKSKLTPLKKMKKMHCESPTALQRRRALEERNQGSPSPTPSSSSELSEIASDLKGPELPFEELLKGVVAYVEVKRDNQDRSEGIKAVMKLMGAVVRDTFTNDVTHVIFKDGCFTTFEKAKLMKMHLVSVLWLDAVRRNNARVPEKNYPAFGNRVCDANVSILCSQLEKDYKEVIKDERRRRHTMMTSKTSFSSYLTAQNVSLSEDERSRDPSKSPQLTSDDSGSECGVIDGHATKRSKESDLLTDDASSTAKNSSTESTSLISHVTVKKKRTTINVLSDMVLTPNVPTSGSNKEIVEGTPQGRKTVEERKKDKVLENSSLKSSSMSSLRMFSDSERTKSGLGGSKQSGGGASGRGSRSSIGNKENNLETDSERTKSGLGGSKQSEGGASGRRSKSLIRNKENSVETVNTTMSSLRLSDDIKKSDEKGKRSRSSSKSSQAKNESTDLTSNIKDKEQKNSRKSKKVTSPNASEDESRKKRETLSSKKTPKEVSNAKKSKKETPPSESGNESQKKAESSTTKKMSDKEGSRSNSKKSVTVSRKSYPEIIFDSEEDSPERTESLSKSKKKSSNIKSAKTNRKKRLDSSESELEESTESKIDSKTPVLPPPEAGDANRSTRRNLRASSVTSITSSASVTSTRRSRRTSVARAIFPPSEEEEASKNERIDSRASSVARTKARESPKRRSASEQRISPVAVVLTRLEDRVGTAEQLKNLSTPSPVKKSRVEAICTVRKRKLYNPNDIVGFSPLAEDKEREEYQRLKSQKSPEGVFLNPNTVRIKPPIFKQKSKSSESNWSSDESEAILVKPKTKKKGKKEKTPPKRDSGADEQRELLELLERAVDPQTRRSERLSFSQTKPKYTFNSESESTSSLPITPMKRRSTLDFVSTSHSQGQRRLKLDPKRTTSIVCTMMHRDEVFNFERTVTKLGRFFVEDKVSGKTTHLIVGEPKRTINMLRAIARGCWILKHEWLLKSETVGKWQSEEDYEVTEFSPAVQQCRLEREAFGSLYSMDIFKDCGFIYVAKGTSPKPVELRELISICKGKVTTIYRNASIVVGEYIDREGVTCVTERWILDSIELNKLQRVRSYLMTSAVLEGSPQF